MAVRSAAVGLTLKPHLTEIALRRLLAYAAGIGATQPCYLDDAAAAGIVAQPGVMCRAGVARRPGVAAPSPVPAPPGRGVAGRPCRPGLDLPPSYPGGRPAPHHGHPGADPSDPPGALGPIQSLAAMSAFYFIYWTNGYGGQWLDLPANGPLYCAATAMTLA